MTPSNLELAELLSREAESHEGRRERALRRAARMALTWPEEAAEAAGAGGRLTDFRGVGPWIAGFLEEWIEHAPDVGDPPPERASFLSMAEARRVLDGAPTWRTAIRGDLQVHTTWSDGRATLDEMAAAARALGHEYVGVTDHSQGLPIARGMDEETLLRELEEIDRANLGLRNEGFRVLRSLEMNLTPEGEGDMDPGALAKLDLVLGAFHSKLRLKEDQTDRYLAAIRNPEVHVLAHPRGRRYGVRLGLSADWERVVVEAERTGTALEVDCFPDRQDLDVPTLRLAAQAEVWISIGTDAHRPDELRSFELGLAAVELAGVPPERVLNLMPSDEVAAWARE